MPAYQLRLKKDQLLDNFVESIAKEIWELAAGYLDDRMIQRDDFRLFENETKIAMQPFIAAHDLCGSFPECTDKVEGRPWLDYKDRIYLFHLPGTFPEMIEELSLSSLDSIRRLTKPGFEELVYETIQSVF